MRSEKGATASSPDHVLFEIDGNPLCDGIDFDHDGKADEWDLLDHGTVVERILIDPKGNPLVLPPAGDAGADPR